MKKMKTSNFFTLIKASVLKYKARSIIFTVFVFLCITSILLTVSIILPIWDNMENKVNNHPYNRQITVELDPDDTKSIEEIKHIKHIENIYPSPSNISVMNKNEKIKSILYLSYFQNGYQPIITSGKCPADNEKNAVVLPEIIHDIDPDTQARIDIDCTQLVGQKLTFNDNYGNTYTLKITGTFDNTDPALSTDCIYTTYSQLIEYSEKINSKNDAVLYSVIVDNYRNNDYVLEQLSKHYNAYLGNSIKIDLNTFNMSLIVLIIILAVFLIMVITGTTIFVNSCIKSRTNEFALYRSLGYKQKHIFTIMVGEYLLLFLTAFVISVIISIISAKFIINPYLSNIIGDSIMSMQAKIGLIDIVIVFIIFLIVLITVCVNATKRTEKIQLAILLKER